MRCRTGKSAIKNPWWRGRVVCEDCEAAGSVRTNPESALRAWNNRASDDEIERLKEIEWMYNDLNR